MFDAVQVFANHLGKASCGNDSDGLGATVYFCQLYLHFFDDVVYHAGMAIHQAGLHGLNCVFANDVTGLFQFNLWKLGCFFEQRFGRNL